MRVTTLCHSRYLKQAFDGFYTKNVNNIKCSNVFELNKCKHLLFITVLKLPNSLTHPVYAILMHLQYILIPMNTGVNYLVDGTNQVTLFLRMVTYVRPRQINSLFGVRRHFETYEGGKNTKHNQAFTGTSLLCGFCSLKNCVGLILYNSM